VASATGCCVYWNNSWVVRPCHLGHATDSIRDCFSFLGYVVHDLGGLCRHVAIYGFQKTKTLTYCSYDDAMSVTLTSSGD